MRIPFFICDSFTNTPFQGNPAGVFLVDEDIPEDTMRRLCLELPLESAFVLPSNVPGADFRLRYFVKTHANTSCSPASLSANVTEVPLCGHATIAALTVLRTQGRLSPDILQQAATPAGLLQVGVTDGGAAVLRQCVPAFADPLTAIDAAEVTNALGYARDSAGHPTLPIQCVSTGTPWLLVPVRTRALVDQTPTDFAAIAALSDRHGVFGIYVFVLETDGGELRVWSRCYAPKAGLNEDPVTGSASGSLGGYLARHGVLPVAPGEEKVFTIQQGFAGGRGGQVSVQAGRDPDGSLSAVTIEGRAIILSEGVFTLA